MEASACIGTIRPLLLSSEKMPASSPSHPLARINLASNLARSDRLLARNSEAPQSPVATQWPFPIGSGTVQNGGRSSRRIMPPAGFTLPQLFTVARGQHGETIIMAGMRQQGVENRWRWRRRLARVFALSLSAQPRLACSRSRRRHLKVTTRMAPKPRARRMSASVPTSPNSIEEIAAEEGRGRLGKLGMIPLDMWRKVLPPERVGSVDEVGVQDGKGRNGASG